MGRLPNEEVADALADIDLLIVPSLWPENSPLTMHEAFLAGTTVLAADAGGMAELLQHGRAGLLFRSGDAADLRRQIMRVVEQPRLLSALRQRVPPVKTIAEDAAEMEARYQQMLTSRS
jgi:glycosyltransferase involved in cell wall biosynthesis